ncbi:permease-like cell division protein FtsX [Ornithinicoccus hortensis]|uniref:Cell division protein FtsX n=1 Tax=Ornithinicoccus hortensis TaxID=82346 RepID=A0A542YRK8_9MICO|nr:permease-like cell division protein FtsX [Ornithinicoccus hortensis]TQL50688.1 cell division protein FtsX [Ornithinicoccus hortensis]
MRLGFLAGEVANGLRRNTSMFVSVVLVTMVSLFFLGSGLLAQRQVDTLKGYWYDRVQVSIFLCTPDNSDVASCAGGGATEAQRDQLARDLDGLSPLVEQYWFESNQEAYDRFRDQFRNSPVLDNIPQESIPESFRVQLSDPTKYDVVASAFEGAPGVESVEDQREVVDKLFTFLNAVSISAVALAGAMVVCSVLLISTTIRLTAYSRRRETTIMRLVGASAFTIHTPFIIETVLATLFGAALAVGLLYAMVHYGIAGFLTDLLAGEGGMIGLIGTGDLWAIVPFLVGGAALLAIVTSWLALIRHVRV